jgi:hypothetical protein
MALAYFSPDGSTVNLEMDQTLRLVFSVSFQDRAESGYFRVGLYDTSGQPRVVHDEITFSHFSFNRARGYMVNLSGLDAGAGVDLRLRQPETPNNSLMNTTRPYRLATGTAATLAHGLPNDTVFDGMLEITRNGPRSVRIRASLAGPDGMVFETAPHVDGSSSFTSSFDTVGFISSDNNGGSFTLHSVAIGGDPGETFRVAATASASLDIPEVARVDLSKLSLDLFSDRELRPGWMTRPMPYYLAHLAEVANSIVTHGEHRGWINRRVWLGAADFREMAPRVMENVLSLIYFYTRQEEWNPYYGDPALRQRLELALDFFLSRMGDDGLLKPRNAEQHVGLQFANTMFFTKFMGEALVLLGDGPSIDDGLHEALLDAQRRALRKVFSSDLAFVQGRQFSNQYGNVFSGAYAYLYLRDDPEIKELFERVIRENVPHFQSPAGFLYENHSVDFGYTLGTHHSNVWAAWHYANLADMDSSWLRKETELWAEWLAYNTVPSPDFSFFFVNRAIEGRQDRPGFDRAVAAFARYVPKLRAMVASDEEIRHQERKVRMDLASSWPRVEPLGTKFSSFSPYAFLHRNHFDWYPTEEERAASRRDLPYLASDRFTHQRVDDRRRLEVTFIRRPGYYAIFNAGEEMSSGQTFGLGLLWHPQAGAVLQSQSRMPEAAWGVVLAGEDRPVENGELEVRYYVNGREIIPAPGNLGLPDGVLEIHYRLQGRNEKFLRFEDDRILVVVNPGGGFSEQIPVLLDAGVEPELGANGVRISSGKGTFVIRPEGHNDISIRRTDREFGGKTVGVVTLDGFRRFAYSLAFE